MVGLALDGPAHQHELTLSPVTGSLVLRVLVTAAVFAVAAYAMARPFLGKPGRAVPVAVTGTAAGAGLLSLLLADGVELPRQAVVPLLAV
ncbi:MAG TPA: DUF6239 family natural product biosynthesis protein, partial [Pilimelia sp.]|nr:DUF6239 family natural product biosynthesis protein [Pilimelia sp.]